MSFSQKVSKRVLSLCIITLLFMASVAGLYWDNYFFIVKSTKVAFVAESVNPAGPTISPSALTTVTPGIKEEAAQKAELALKKLYGKNIWRLNLQIVQDSLLENKWIESVSVVRDLPDALRVEFKFKNIVFLYLDKKQQLIPVSASGDLLSPVSTEHAPDAPLIKSSSLIADKEKLRHMISLYQQLPAEGLISTRNIAEVDWSDTEGFKVELIQWDHERTEADGFIVLGTDQMKMKAKRVESVLKYLGSQKQRWRVIDASFSKKVLVRLRKRS